MSPATQTSWAEHALAALRAAGYRRGGARTAVVEALARHDCAVTALDLDDELRRRKPAVGPSIVHPIAASVRNGRTPPPTFPGVPMLIPGGQRPPSPLEKANG